MRRMLLIIVSLLVISGCASNSTEDNTIYVAAASDLYHALTEIGEEFTVETGINVEFTFGSTGLLTQQIKEGAPFDLFTAAHESYIDDLINSGAVLENSKANYAIGRIVMMGENVKGSNFADALLSSEVKTITIANPDHAPYGKAAKEALLSVGIWEEIESKIVYAENIRQAYQYVESGNADVGIVALALVNGTEYEFELMDDQHHEPIIQALGIPSHSEKVEKSEQLAKFIQSDRGQTLLKKYGFDIP